MFFKLVSITQFGVIPPTCPFRRDGSHIWGNLALPWLAGYFIHYWVKPSFSNLQNFLDLAILPMLWCLGTVWCHHYIFSFTVVSSLAAILSLLCPSSDLGSWNVSCPPTICVFDLLHDVFDFRTKSQAPVSVYIGHETLIRWQCKCTALKCLT